MTPDKLRAIMDKHGLAQTDLAAIAGKTTRQVHSWLSSVAPVPRSLALILHAIDDGLITAADLVKWIRREATHRETPAKTK